jgi:hypothetical protein
MGRAPAGAERVGCIGRRSPGRSGGRGAPTPGPAGRGRWKIGWPGTGRPGAGRAAPAAEAPACPIGTPGRGGGALYTGRGPVCGTIMRGAGGCGAAATGGIAGRGATGVAAGGAEAVIDGAAGGWATTAGGAGGRGGTAIGAAGLTGAAVFSTGGTIAGRGGAVAGDGTGAAGGVGLATRGATIGLATADGGVAGRGATGGAAAASFRCVMALSTSPGREMCERSILVLISSSPRSVRADFAADAGASDEPRRWARTFSASCSSRELECVFFSVTPTIVNTSRMALLFTSSSLARSLIRTLLIRPFFTPSCA